MKVDPKYGYYPWWPENGNEWIHPEDVELAREMIPSARIFRRDGEQEPFVILHYGDMRLRVMRTLWQEVAWEGFEIGDWVEVLSRGFKNTPRTAIVREITWDAHARALRYQVAENDTLIPNLYGADDLRHVDPPGNKSTQ
jgi:hypothetical protein